MIELLAGIFIGVGLAFDLFGTIGLVRLPDIYNRVQAATKCVTLGTCMILFGVFLHSGVNAMGVKALICMVFVLLTSPVAGVRDAYKEFREGRAEQETESEAL